MNCLGGNFVGHSYAYTSRAKDLLSHHNNIKLFVLV